MTPRVCCPDEDLIVLGDGACLGAYAYLLGHEMTRNGKFKRGPVTVGASSIVGPAARLSPFVTTEADSNVPALVSAVPGQKFLPVAAAVAVAMLPPSRMPPGPLPSPPASPPGPPPPALTVAALALHARREPVPQKRHDQGCARLTESTAKRATDPFERAISLGEKVGEKTCPAHHMHIGMVVHMPMYAILTCPHLLLYPVAPGPWYGAFDCDECAGPEA